MMLVNEKGVTDGRDKVSFDQQVQRGLSLTTGLMWDEFGPSKFI